MVGLGALVKPSSPTTGGATSTPSAKSSAAPRPSSPKTPALAAAGPRSLGDPRTVAACLASLGFKTGELQKVPLNLWQAVSPKVLADGDVNLFVCGLSPSTLKTVELEATASAAGLRAAIDELLRALPILLKELTLPMPGELAATIEAAATATGMAESALEVAGVRVECTARTLGDQRAVRVRLTLAQR